MRRTPSFIWIPFVFSVGTISWAILIAGIALLAAIVLTPAIRDVKAAEKTRNDYAATLKLLDQKIELQKEFTAAAAKDPVLMERLASRQLNLNRKDQDILILDPAVLYKDRSVDSLLAESLTPVTPKPASAPIAPLAIKPIADIVGNAALRPILIVMSLAAIALSFFLGVKYERTPH